MTLADDCVNYGKLAFRWLCGVSLWALGAWVLVKGVAVWPGIGLITFGAFIVIPNELKAFAAWFRENAAAYLQKPGGGT